MKKILFLFLTIVSFSCDKNDVEPNEDFNQNSLNTLSVDVPALAWEEYIPELTEENYLNPDLPAGDIRHTLVVYNNELYEFYDEELIAKIPVTVSDNTINVALPNEEIMTLTIQENGSLTNNANIVFASVSIETTASLKGPVRKLCEAACLATHRALGVPRFLDSICCFWLSDKWDGAPWL